MRLLRVLAVAFNAIWIAIGVIAFVAGLANATSSLVVPLARPRPIPAA